MKILILPDAAAAARAAGIVARTLQAKPDAVLGLATGGTMQPVYAELVRRNRAGDLSFARAVSFNLDEYVSLSRDHPGSYHRAMKTALFAQTDFRPHATHLPRGDAPDPMAEAEAYEARITAAGSIDLQLMGIGTNGHIGFNEPGSALTSQSRVVPLARETRAANRRYFDSDADVPTLAITMGIATILAARACLLLATGTAKAQAVAAMAMGEIGPACPASALRLHGDATVLLDPAAAALLDPAIVATMDAAHG